MKAYEAVTQNRALLVIALLAVSIVTVIAILGGPSTYDDECRTVDNPTAVKQPDPDEMVTMGEGRQLVIDYGHNRGMLEDEAELPMKSVGGASVLPDGPVAISHSLLERSDGDTSSINDQAVALSATANGRTLRVRLCVDTTKDPDIAPGRYLGVASIDDARFDLSQGVPIEVVLQTPYLWRLGAPLALGVLVGGIWLAALAAGQPLRDLDVGIAVSIVGAVVTVATQAFLANGVADPTFGFDPIVQWLALAWAMGTAVTAAATAVFTTDAVRRSRTALPPDEARDDRALVAAGDR